MSFRSLKEDHCGCDNDVRTTYDEYLPLKSPYGAICTSQIRVLDGEHVSLQTSIPNRYNSRLIITFEYSRLLGKSSAKQTTHLRPPSLYSGLVTTMSTYMQDTNAYVRGTWIPEYAEMSRRIRYTSNVHGEIINHSVCIFSHIIQLNVLSIPLDRCATMTNWELE